MLPLSSLSDSPLLAPAHDEAAVDLVEVEDVRRPAELEHHVVIELIGSGCVGMIATKTIAKGDTRKSGLTQILKSGARLYAVTKRIPWPGAASVTISTVALAKGVPTAVPRLDGKAVDRISAFLLPLGGDEDPQKLAANEGIAFGGYKLDGLGFTFDDGTPEAEPLSSLKQILLSNPKNAERIHPVLAGHEILSDARHTPSRYVIDFEEMPLEKARQWPDLLSIVERRVLPIRRQNKRDKRRQLWWQFGEVSPGLRDLVRQRKRVLVHPYTSTHLAFVFVESAMRVIAPHVVIGLEDDGSFSVLQSCVHDEWLRMTGGARHDDLVYLVSDCFRTFPFPKQWTTLAMLEAAGKGYYKFRSDLMIKNQEGLTKTYNRFHDPGERDEGIVVLRELHTAMDRAVLDAYGWSDIPTDCEFLLDYEIDEEEWGDKKKPYRYRWPDEVRDKVLAQLLELNAERAKEEVRSGAATAKKVRKKAAAKSPFKQPDTQDLLS